MNGTVRSAPPPSPFGRRVRIAIVLLGLSDRVRIEIADTADPNETLRTQNPLGKIPTLLLKNGDALYDYRVIVEYLDARAAPCVSRKTPGRRLP